MDHNTERELNKIWGKFSVNAVSKEEINIFLFYVLQLEQLLDEADEHDFFGTEGWRKLIDLTLK